MACLTVFGPCHEALAALAVASANGVCVEFDGSRGEVGIATAEGEILGAAAAARFVARLSSSSVAGRGAFVSSKVRGVVLGVVVFW
jgi:hypothetical protein